MFFARLLMFVLAFLPMTQKVEAGFWDNLRGMIWKSHTKAPPLIDVLVVNDKPGVMLEATGTYQLIDPNTKQFIGKRRLGKKRYFQSHPAGLKWGEEFPGIYQLELIPDDLSVATVIDGVEYKGILYIYDIGGAISIVNRVPIEEYLLSVVPRKFPEPLHEEALSAIAITARTDALYQAQNPKNKYWAIDSSSSGYRGVSSYLSDSQMDHAIRATRHMVLSKTGSYEGVITPFQAYWGVQAARQAGHQQGGLSRISVQEAENMAKDGQHAAQILSKAFPGTHIEIIY